MSSSDSSSRETSPQRQFRSVSPGSDDDTSPSANPFSSAFQSYSSPFQPSAAAAPVLRQPVGFSWNAPGFSTYQAGAPPSQLGHFLPGQGAAAPPEAETSTKKKSSKDKKKEKDRSKSSSSRKHKDKNPAQPQHPHPTSIAPAALPSTSIGLGRPSSQTAFRVRSYVNDPSASGSAFPQATGPYTSDFRTNSAASSAHSAGSSHHFQGHPTHAPVGHPTAHHGQASQEQSQRSYYRNNYERQRDNAPARRAQAHATTSSAASNNSIPPSHVHPPASSPTPNPYNDYTQPSYTNPHPQSYTPAPMPEYSSFGPDSRPFDSFTTPPPAPVPPAKSKHKSGDRSRRSRKHEHQPESYQSSPAVPHSVATPVPSAPVPPAPPPSNSAPAPPMGARVLRTLTLLIEDKRTAEPENLLVEVRVPLKQADNPEDGFWADAKEVCDELQIGPSRIDGRAKLYVMRGKYRQYFLRVTPEGGNECSSANLKVTRERTLEIFVDNLPLPVGASTQSTQNAQDSQYSSPHYDRDLLTPITDSMASPSPMNGPRLRTPFPSETLDTPSHDDSRSRRKRRHSTSSRSSVSDKHSRPSPYLHESSTSQTSPASHASPTFQASPVGEPSPLSRHSPVRYSPAPAPAPTPPPATSYPASNPYTLPSTMSETPFSQPEPATTHSTSHALPDPSVLKKAKRSAVDPQPAPPDERMSFAWSHSRTESTSGHSPATAVPSAPVPFPQPSTPFSMPAPQSNMMGSTPAKEGPAFPQMLPTSSTASNPEVDNVVGTYLRSIICQGPAWDAFVEGRRSVLRMFEQLKQYQYMKSNFDQFVNTLTPPDLDGAPSVYITRTQVLRAFNLPPSWGDECMETLGLTGLYGPTGKRCQDPRVVTMLDELPPISTGMQVKKYLALLREIHSRWTIDHPDF